MFRYLIILSFAFMIEACSTTRVVQLPPIQPPPGVTTGQVESAIKTAINSYKGAWAVEDAQPGFIIAGLHVRNHYLKVEIEYTEQEISSNIISSENLKQHDHSIHKRALYWQSRLDTAIQQEINELRAPDKTGSGIPEKPYTQRPEETNNVSLKEPGQEKQKEPEPIKQDQTALETPKETGSRTPEQTILETSKEPVSQTPEEIGLEIPDETNSKRTWKTYFEVQEEKARDIK